MHDTGSLQKHVICVYLSGHKLRRMHNDKYNNHANASKASELIIQPTWHTTGLAVVV